MRSALLTGLLTAAVFAQTPSAFGQVNVRALSVVPDSTAIAGRSIDLVASFISDDDQAMPPFRWRIVLTVDGALDTAITVASIGLTTLPQGQPQLFNISRTLPVNVSGFYTLAIVADYDASVAESNEFDNFAIASSPTHIIAQAPDLDVVTVNISATERRATESIDVGFSIANDGELAGNVLVGAYLSHDPVVTPSDLLLGTTMMNVGEGATLSGSIAGVVPSGIPAGDYVVGVIADPDGLVTEHDETNNGFANDRLNVFSDALVLATEDVPDGTLSIDYHLQLHADGGDGHHVFTAIGALPNGLSLTEDGTLAGTPSRTGTYSFEIEVTSRGLSDRRPYEVEIFSTFQPLRIYTLAVEDGHHRYPYQQNLVAGGGEPPYQWRLTEGEGAIAPGLDLSTNGVISGIPSQLGTFGFSVTVEDRLGAIDSLHYEIEIVPVATVLILSTEAPHGFAGEPLDYPLSAIGGVPPYRWEAASTPPPGLSVTEDGRIAGTPERVGVWPLRVRVTDSTSGGATDTALFQIAIDDGSDFHVVTESLPVGLVRSRYQVAIEAENGTPPYRWSLGPGDELPEGFFLTQGDGQTYSTDAAIIGGRAFRPLIHGFSLVVEDAQGRRRQVPFAIVIDSGNGNIDAGCTGVETKQGSSLHFLVLLGLTLFLRRRK